MDFLKEKETFGFLPTDEIQSVAPAKGQLTTSLEEQDAGVSTGLTDTEIRGLAQSNRIADMYISETELPPTEATGDITPILSRALNEMSDLSVVQNAADKDQLVKDTLYEAGTLTSVQRALAVDPTVAAQLYKIESRAESSRRILLDKLEGMHDDGAAGVLDFVDQAIYDTYIGMRDVGELLGGEGSEVSQLSDQWEVALRTLDDEQFKEFVAERLGNTDDFVYGEGRWRVYRELQALDSAGAVLWDEQMGVLYGAMSALDIATLGTTASLTAARVGRSAFGRLRSTAGTTAASEAVAGTNLVVRGGLDGEILDPVLGIEDLRSAVPGTGPGPSPRRRPGFTIRDDIEDAVIIDDIMPRAYTTRTASPNIPPVSSGYVATQFATNKYVQWFLQAQEKFSFGALEGFEQGLDTWARDAAKKITDKYDSSLIDFDIDVQDIFQAKATFSFGKQNGLPFSDVVAAQKFAESIPNAKVVPSGRNQWRVQAEALVPIKETIGALDLSQLGNRTGIGRFFFSAGRGGSDALNNLADAGDFGGIGFKQQFKNEIAKLNKLAGKDIDVINNIITSLRDKPTRGNARSWLNPGEFATAYQSLTGKMPTRKVMEAYEEAIQLSDFSWYVQANERLRSLANQKASVINIKGDDRFAFPTTRTVEGLKKDRGPVYVWDVAKKKKVNVKTLPDDRPILALGIADKDGIEYVTNFIGSTRVPTLKDAFPYSAGGPRSNPRLTWFVGNRDGGWTTLIGARSEKDAAKAVDQFNAIVAAVKAGSPRSVIDDVIRKNNDWNPSIENLDDLKRFANARDVSLTDFVVKRERNQKLSAEGVVINDESLINLSYEQYVTLHRQDAMMYEFGGRPADNPDPLTAILFQWNQMVTRGAQTQYRMSHPSAWVKALDKLAKEGKVSADIPSVPMTDEMKVRNIKILGNTKAERKLINEQSVIVRRLEMLEGSTSFGIFDRAGEAVSRTAARAVEVAHDFHPKGGDIGHWIKTNFVDQGNNRLLSLGFFQAMASLDQIIVQSSHAIPIMAISPKNGLRGLTIATAIRNAARAGDTSAWAAMSRNLSKNLGIPEQELKNLTEHMLYSGRGFMKGAISEDPSAGMSNTIMGKVKDVITTPYYAGENFAASLSRVTAYLDTRDAFPSLDPTSKGFWNAVQKRDRTLSFSLNNAQRSMAQSDSVSRVVTQWTSYPLRQIEMMLFEKNLTVAERARMTAMMTILWGAAGTGAVQSAAWIQEKFGVEMPLLASIIVNGVDEALDGLAGVKLGERLAFRPAELLERGVMTFVQPWEEIPAVSFLNNVGSPLVSGMANFLSGRWSLLGHDAETLARAFKIVDAPIMAYSMMMEDVRRSRTGSELRAEFTPIQEALQAIGFTPSEAVDLRRMTTITFDKKGNYKRAVKKVTPIFKMAIEAAEEGNQRKYRQLITTADAVARGHGLTTVQLIDLKDEVFKNLTFDRVNYTILEMIKNDYQAMALEFQERIEN